MAIGFIKEVSRLSRVSYKERNRKRWAVAKHLHPGWHPYQTEPSTSGSSQMKPHHIVGILEAK
jgi:hypothetical protein